MGIPFVYVELWGDPPATDWVCNYIFLHDLDWTKLIPNEVVERQESWAVYSNEWATLMQHRTKYALLHVRLMPEWMGPYQQLLVFTCSLTKRVYIHPSCGSFFWSFLCSRVMAVWRIFRFSIFQCARCLSPPAGYNGSSRLLVHPYRPQQCHRGQWKEPRHGVEGACIWHSQRCQVWGFFRWPWLWNRAKNRGNRGRGIMNPLYLQLIILYTFYPVTVTLKV